MTNTTSTELRDLIERIVEDDTSADVATIVDRVVAATPPEKLELFYRESLLHFVRLEVNDQRNAAMSEVYHKPSVKSAKAKPTVIRKPKSATTEMGPDTAETAVEDTTDTTDESRADTEPDTTEETPAKQVTHSAKLEQRGDFEALCATILSIRGHDRLFGDCTVPDFEWAAADRRSRAAAFLGKADQFSKVATLMTEFGAQTARELPDEAVAQLAA